jgi:hypothetical protein
VGISLLVGVAGIAVVFIEVLQAHAKAENQLDETLRFGCFPPFDFVAQVGRLRGSFQSFCTRKQLAIKRLEFPNLKHDTKNA